MRPAMAKHKKQARKGAMKNTVEPFDDTTVHARFDPKPRRKTEEPGIREDVALEGDALGDDVLVNDPMSYVWEEADESEEGDEDTDSCMTYEDAESTDTEHGPCSPAGDATFSLRRRQGRASEAPVYVGPQLLYDDLNFDF